MSDTITTQPGVDDTNFFQKQVAKLPPRWKLALVRCSIYAIIVGWGSFETGIEGYNAFSEMTQMQLLKLCGNIVVSMLGVWLAFLDQSLSKADSAKTEPPRTGQ